MEMTATPIVVPLPGPIHLPLQFHGPMQQTHQNRVPISLNHAAQPAVGLVPPPPNHVQQVPLPVVLPMHPGQVHAAIQVTETREEQPSSPDQVPMQVETHEGRVMHRIPIQVEAREGRTFQQIPIQVTTHEGRAFPHRLLPVQVETHEGQTFHHHQPQPIPEESQEGRAFQPLQIEGREGRAFQHQHIPLRMAESRGFNPDAAAAAAAVMHASEGRVFHQQSPAPEMVNHQQFPVHIPVPMMQQIQVEEQPQPRPHCEYLLALNVCRCMGY